MIGLVDSGADGSLLPLSICPNLGINPNTDLTPVSGGSGGAGGTSFPTWETTHAVSGQILCIPPAGGQAFLWGPTIALRPKFAAGSHALFGRADFFTYFAISFARDPTLGPVFHLDH